MSGISSGIGLISGIDTATLIEQLMAIERRPLNNLQQRVDALQVQRAAFMELSAKLLAVQSSAMSASRPSFFRRFQVDVSNSAIVQALASESASPGSITFRVRSLVSNHALISRGFADADRTPIGAGRLSIEVGNGRVNRGTPLDMLNGGAGVRRGSITMTDRSGASAEIDLSAAKSVDDVLAAINGNPAINVRASVTSVEHNGAVGDRIVIEDLTPDAQATQALTITDAAGGFTAEDLGIAGSVQGNRLDGRDLVRLSLSTPLSLLNDRNGVDRLASGPDLEFSTSFGDFSVSLADTLAGSLDTDLRMLNSGAGVRLGTIRITDRSRQSAEIDLSGARTVRDVLDAINASGVSVSATVVNSSLLITDTTGLPAGDESAGSLTIEDVSGFAAADLGIAGASDKEFLQGREVYRIHTLGDVMNAINFAAGNDGLVEASISSDGKRITLRAISEGNRVTVQAGRDAAGNESGAARDLGLVDVTDVSSFESRRLVAGLNTVLLRSLHGGQGVQTGQVRFVDRAGNAATIDFSGVETLQEVIDRINAESGLSIQASVNGTGAGIVLRDVTGGSAGELTVEDVTGSLAEDLRISTEGEGVPPGDIIDSGNLQLQYVSRRTALAELNGGRGISAGSIQITDSAGAAYTVTIDANLKTVGQLVDRINADTGPTILARINDTGDGVLIEDLAGGSLALTIEDQSGARTARDLHLAGTAAAGQNFIDGSYEIQIDIDATDTLSDLVRKINEAGAAFSASVLNHGTGLNPFSLTITSEAAGRKGELVFSTSGVDLGLATLSRAQDAVITIGDPSAGQQIVITGSSNTFQDVLPGVTINALSVSDEPVTVTIGQNVDAIVESIKKFVDEFNSVMEAIDQQTRFDSETLDRGPLLGDPTVNLVRSRMLRVILRPVEGVDASVSRLFSVGLRLKDGNRLQFDEDQFRAAYERSPQAVEEMFTREETGFGVVLQQSIEELTDSFDGLVSRKNNVLSDQQEILRKRMDSLNVLLDAKRARLETQFIGLEQVLAALQQQQSSLSLLAQLAAGPAIG